MAKAATGRPGFKNAWGKTDGPIPQNRRRPSAKWQRSYGMYITGQAMVDEVTLLADGLERVWGAGRLRLIVGEELRAKFDRQRFLCSQAMQAGDLEDVRRETQRMAKAWRALEREALAGGKRPHPVEAWDIVSPDGCLYVVVRNGDDAKAWRSMQDDPRQGQVYTMEEIACLLDAQGFVRTVKETFEGAELLGVARNVGDALEDVTDDFRGIDDVDGGELDEEVPF